MKKNLVLLTLLLTAVIFVCSGFSAAKNAPMFKEPADMTGYWVATATVKTSEGKIPVMRAFSMDYKFFRELRRMPGTPYLMESDYVEMFPTVKYVKGKSFTFCTGDDFSEAYKVTSRPTSNTAVINMYCGETNRIITWKATRFSKIEDASAFVSKNCKSVLAREKKADEARYVEGLSAFYTEETLPEGWFYNDANKRVYIDPKTTTIEVGNDVMDTYKMYRYSVEIVPPKGTSGFDLAEKLIYTNLNDPKAVFVLTVGSEGEFTSAKVYYNEELLWHTEATFRKSEY